MELSQLRHEAVLHHRAGRLAEAERAYRLLQERQPTSTVASNLGALLRSQGRLEEAQTHYHGALQTWPDDVSLLANACNLLRDLGQTELTVRLLERGLAQAPTDFGLRQGLALSLHQLGRLDEALALLGRCWLSSRRTPIFIWSLAPV
jgi:protein O-GlcNAc transferase